MDYTTAAATTYRPRWDARLTWDIEDFDANSLQKSSLSSGKLPIESSTLSRELKWEITLELIQTNIVIGLHLQTNDPGKYDCSFGLILGEVGGTNIVRSGQETYVTSIFKRGGYYCDPKNKAKIPLVQLTGQKDNIYPRGTLHIKVELHMTLPYISKIGGKEFPGYKINNENSSEKKMAGFYCNKLYSDVIIKCQDKIYPCHRLILDQSAVFAKMFSTQMKESITKEIVISDVTPPVVEMFLKSLYCQPFAMSTDYKELLELTDCAERYDLAELKAKCLQSLASVISEDNAGELNVAVHRYSQDEECRRFFKDYCLKRQATLTKNPTYKKLCLENIDLFM